MTSSVRVQLQAYVRLGLNAQYELDDVYTVMLYKVAQRDTDLVR